MSLHAHFSPAQIETLRAVHDSLIPPDEFPGAWANGSGDYLERQFAGDLGEALPLYQAGLTALEAEAVAVAGRPFAQATEEQQDEILSALEKAEVQTAWPISPRQFFEMLVNHSAEGFYGDPSNGGNIEKASWQMIGFLDR